MKKASILIVFLFFTLFKSYSQITAAAALVALDELQAKLSSVIEDAENAGNNVINTAATGSSHLIYTFKEHYKDILKSTEKTLDGQTYQLYYQITQASQKVIDATSDALKEVEKVSTNLDYAISRLPMSSKRPFVSKVSAPVFGASSEKEEYELVLVGNLLDRGEKLKVGGKHVKASEVSTKKLVYFIPFDVIRNKKTTILNFELKLKYPGFHFFPKTAKYRFYAKLVPLEYGKVDVNFSTEKDDTVFINRSETFPPTRTDGSNWRGRREKKKQNFPVHPSTADNEILVNTVSLKTLENRYGYGADIVSKSPAALLVQQHARSQNKPYGGGGKVQSRVSFTEIKVTKKQGEQELTNVPMYFNDPLVISLPEHTSLVQRINVTLYDGKKLTLTTENNNKNFEVQYRKVDRTLFIKHKVL